MHFLCLTPNCSEGGPSRFIFATKKVGKEKANKERGKAFEVTFFLPFIKYESCLCLWGLHYIFSRILWGLSWETPLWGLCHAPIQNFCTNSNNSQEP